MCKIAILEGFNLLSFGLKSILLEENKCDVIVQAKTADKLITELNGTVPDVIVIDIIHADNSGVKPLKKIRRIYKNTPVLLIVSKQYSDCFEDYIRLGVKGFVFDNSDASELVKAIKKLEEGEEYFSTVVWKIFKSSMQRRTRRKTGSGKLTDREVSVLRLFSNGLSYKEIGKNLNISPRTVETHKRNILSKLKIRTTAEMIKYAFHHHILT